MYTPAQLSDLQTWQRPYAGSLKGTFAVPRNNCPPSGTPPKCFVTTLRDRFLTAWAFERYSAASLRHAHAFRLYSHFRKTTHPEQWLAAYRNTKHPAHNATYMMWNQSRPENLVWRGGVYVG